MVADAIYHSFF